MPFPTPFNSRNWLYSKDIEQPIGEVRGAPRIWSRGTLGPLFVGGNTCGDAFDFRFGLPLSGPQASFGLSPVRTCCIGFQANRSLNGAGPGIVALVTENSGRALRLDRVTQDSFMSRGLDVWWVRLPGEDAMNLLQKIGAVFRPFTFITRWRMPEFPDHGDVYWYRWDLPSAGSLYPQDTLVRVRVLL